MTIYFKGPNSMFEPISIQLYSDNTPMVKTLGFSRIAARADTMVIKADSMLEFFTGIMLAQSLFIQTERQMNLVLPYIPGARQDRCNPSGDVLQTMLSVGSMVYSTFHRVVVLDPHSDFARHVMPSMEEYPLSNIAKSISDNAHDGVIAPDAGSHKRAEEFAKTLGLPTFYGGKKRDISNGRLNGFELEKIPKGHYLVVDDICDGGGTFVGLAGKIEEQGSTADLYVSHGIFSKGTDELEKHYKQIFTTDSRNVNPRNNVTIIPVVKDMEKFL